jgi:hypothetical protein
MPGGNLAPNGREGASSGRPDQRRLVHFHHRPVRGPEMMPFASQRDGMGRVEPAKAFRRERQLHAVKTRAVMVVMLAAIGRAFPLIERLVTVLAVAVGVMCACIPAVVGMGVFRRDFRTAQSVTPYAAKQTQMDQQADENDAGKPHADDGSVSAGVSESQGLYSARCMSEISGTNRICRFFTPSPGVPVPRRDRRVRRGR